MKLERTTISIGNEEYLELEGEKVGERLVSEHYEERRNHIGNGLHSTYKIKVIHKEEKWVVNNKEITVFIIEEYYNENKPAISKTSREVMDMLVYKEKTVEEVKEILNIK